MNTGQDHAKVIVNHPHHEYLKYSFIRTSKENVYHMTKQTNKKPRKLIQTTLLCSKIYRAISIPQLV